MPEENLAPESAAAPEVATPAPTKSYATSPVPTPGRIVHYTLSAADAAKINHWRSDAHPLHDFEGNQASEGDVLPMLIVRTWGPTPESAVNGQVFLDGNGSLWVTSTSVGEGPGRFTWPGRV